MENKEIALEMLKILSPVILARCSTAESTTMNVCELFDYYDVILERLSREDSNLLTCDKKQ